MENIYSIISDEILDEELILGLKKRNIDQKFIYMDKGAHIYYDKITTNTETLNLGEGITTNFIDPTKRKNKKIFDSNEESHSTPNNFFNDFMIQKPYRKYKTCIISLCCGNAEEEKQLLNNLSSNGNEISYFAVDTSISMLKLAQNNLKNINIKKQFIRADVLSSNFIEKIKTLTQEFEIKIFAFFGGTFIGPNQTNLIESFFNLMGKNDILWFDIPTYNKQDKYKEDIIIDKYLNYTNNHYETKTMTMGLQKVGINLNNGILKMALAKEESIGSILFKYYFEIKQKVQINFSKYTFTFLPKEKISLLDVRIYHLDTFLSFIQEHGFHLIDKKDKETHEILGKSQCLLKKT